MKRERRQRRTGTASCVAGCARTISPTAAALTRQCTIQAMSIQTTGRSGCLQPCLACKGTTLPSVSTLTAPADTLAGAVARPAPRSSRCSPSQTTMKQDQTHHFRWSQIHSVPAWDSSNPYQNPLPSYPDPHWIASHPRLHQRTITSHALRAPQRTC